MKILEILPNPADSTSFYRGRGPFAALYKSYPEIDLIPITGAQIGELTWAEIELCDIVFLQRPHGFHMAVFAEQVKEMGKSLWVDYDDYLLNVPEYNPHHKMYDLEGIKGSIHGIIGVADVVTVSTPELYGLFMGHVPSANIEIIPNAHNDFLLKELVKFNEKSKIVYWRGSNTHDFDVYSAKEAINELIKDSEAEVHFIGHRFPYLSDKAHYHPLTSDIIEYFRFLRDLKPALCINPLIKNDFNMGKSNIAWLEATYAGGACWAPEYIPDFDKPGVITYPGPDIVTHDTISTICWGEMEEQHKISWEYICENLLLSKINEKRWDIVQRLS